jgi:hypothetical protein
MSRHCRPERCLFREDSGRRDPLLNHDGAQHHGQQYLTALLDNRAYLVLVAEEHGEVTRYLAGEALASARHQYAPVRWNRRHAHRASLSEREMMYAEAIRHFYGYHRASQP